ncbi:MAG: ATP-dependent helicase [Candidatus Pacebacteria bacterium]|nr:ATP-dependent helicase [Candidatus Paceibacterota bacterium]
MSKTTPAFKKSYSILNPAQKKAVDVIDGPVMVIAGPGTGKTQVLATRIANILRQTDTEPRSILALTFTESAASNMRERLVKMIGKTGYYVQITTFHSFCSDIISSNPEYFSIDRDSEPLSDIERYDFFSQIILDLNIEALKPLNRPLFYLRDIMKSISDLKRENISIEEFSEMIEAEAEQLEEDLKKTARTKLEKKINKNKELVLIYDHYQKKLRENLRYDFDDMIALVVDALGNNEDLLLDYQENLHYFLVDEYQDTNTAQNRIVDLLASYWREEQPNIFVVGDPNQSIYRFQGASVENALSFSDKYPQAEIITLTQGYRCPQNIYSAAHSLISENNLTQEDTITPNLSNNRLMILHQLNKRLEAHSPLKSTINITTSPSRTVELVNLAQQLKDLIEKKKIDPKEIAVLFRNNKEATELKDILHRFDIDYEIDSSANILDIELIRQLIAYLKVINLINDDDREIDIFEVLNYEWLNLDHLSLMKITKVASLNRLSILEILDQDFTQHKTQFDDFNLTKESFLTFQEKLTQLRDFNHQDASFTFITWFEKVINESGFLSHIKTLPDRYEIIVALKSLFDQIKNLNQTNHQLKLNDFLNTLDLMAEHNITIKAENIQTKENAIHLSTAHKAKGQEWDYVFMIDLIDGKWGNTKKRELIPLPDGVLKNTNIDKKERNEDDRRLFYVGITRAKKKLFLSWSKTKSSGNTTKTQVESMFLSELGEETQIKHNEVNSINEEKLLQLIEKTEPTDEQKQINEATKKFFSKLVKDFKLSSTALNTYLRDPLEFVENNLLRIPKAKALHMSFGTAIHAALEFIFTVQKNTKQFPTLEQLFQNFDIHLQKEILTQKDYKLRLKHGKKILELYYQTHKDKQFEVMGLETAFGGSKNKVILEKDIHLSGRVDRIDWLDKDKKIIKVIDYKTGKPKSENQINGQVSTSEFSERELALPEQIRGAYKRQLLFYKLLIDNDPTFKYKISHAAFEFIEPSTSNKQVTRLFELTDEDTNLLKELIIQVMSEINNLEFLEYLK